LIPPITAPPASLAMVTRKNSTSRKTDSSFAIGWKGNYQIDGDAFIFIDRDTARVTTILGYPTRRLAQLGWSENFKYLWLVLYFRRSQQSDDGGASPAGLERSIAIVGHKRRAGEYGPDHFTLYADSSSMNDSQRSHSEAVRFREILFDNGFHVARRNAVKIENIGYRNSKWLFGKFAHK
jgi:hypothetical protein